MDKKLRSVPELEAAFVNSTQTEQGESPPWKLASSPELCCKTEVAGMEVLSRWRDESHGALWRQGQRLASEGLGGGTTYCMAWGMASLSFRLHIWEVGLCLPQKGCEVRVTLHEYLFQVVLLVLKRAHHSIAYLKGSATSVLWHRLFLDPCLKWGFFPPPSFSSLKSKIFALGNNMFEI